MKWTDILAGYWVRVLLCLSIPLVFSVLLLRADSYLKSSSRSRSAYLLKKAGVNPSISEAVNAASAGRLFSLDMLHLAGVDLGQMDESGRTPLMAAIRDDASSTARYLVEIFQVERTLSTKSADSGSTAFEDAVRMGRLSLAARIRRSENELNPANFPPLEEILINNPDFFPDFRKLGISPQEAIGKRGEDLPLLLAVEKGDMSRIRRLIERGANVDITGADGNSILVGAIRKGKYELVTELINAGAQLNPKAPLLVGTPLEAAIQSADIRMIQLLLDQGADPNRHPAGTPPPIAVAIRNRNSKLAAQLIASGAKTSQPGLAFTALQNNDRVSLQLLLNNGVSPNRKDSEGMRLLDRALFLNREDCVKMLLSAGADTDQCLAYAIQSENPELIDLILTHGADMDELGGTEGSALLDYAFKTDNMKLVAILLKHGASLDVIDRDDGILLKKPPTGNE